MRPASTPSNRGGTPSEVLIEVEVKPACAPEFAAVVSLRGEHDIATAPEVMMAITSISGSVLVDLSECTFVDSTVISVLLSGSEELEREGHRLELLVPVENTMVLHTLALTGVTRVVPVHVVRPG